MTGEVTEFVHILDFGEDGHNYSGELETHYRVVITAGEVQISRVYPTSVNCKIDPESGNIGIVEKI